jgi:uncharacterized phage protein (TIGR02218 family)
MKSLPPALSQHLASGVTTLCWCWKLTPSTGAALGFTDHDRDISFSGLTYRAQTGFAASEMHQATGFGTDNLDVAGALDDTRLSETRLRAGDFDGADIEIWLVNWQEPEQRLLLRKGHLGEVSHGELGFTAELRGLIEQLGQPQGRLFQYGCDAVLGDQRCRVDLDQPAFKGSASVVSASDNRVLLVTGLEAFAADWFAGGTLTFVSGANAGRRAEVKSHGLRVSGQQLELWQAPPFAIAAGDAITVTAGCDRQFSTCRGKFANAVNFRGFPHMPGNDFVTSYPNRDDAANDGGVSHG